MIEARSQELIPPPAAEPTTDGRKETWWTFVVFAFAIGLLLAGRNFAPVTLRVWFAALPIASPTDLLALLSALIAVVITHELGHLMAAIALNFELLGLAFGPIRVQWLHGRRKCYLRQGSFWSASISAVPTNMNHWRLATMTVVAAGPLATLGVMLGVARIQASNHWLLLFQLAFVQISFLIFVLGLFPNSNQARSQNDARQFFNLARRNPGAEELELKFLLLEQRILGQRPSDYPRKLLKRLATWQGPIDCRIMFAQALVQWALDSEELLIADRWDRYALSLAEQFRSPSLNEALASSACLDVLYRNDMESACNKFVRVDFKRLFPPCFEHRARAAQQIALGRPHRAIPQIILAQYSLVHAHLYYEWERTMLDKMHARVFEFSKPAVESFSIATA